MEYLIDCCPSKFRRDLNELMSSEQSHDTNKKLEWYCPYFSHSMIHFTVPQHDISKDPDCLYQELEGVSFLLVHWELNVHGISQGLHQEFWMSLLSRMAMERYFLAFCIGNGPKHMKTWSDHTTVISFCIHSCYSTMDGCLCTAKTGSTEMVSFENRVARLHHSWARWKGFANTIQRCIQFSAHLCRNL